MMLPNFERHAGDTARDAAALLNTMLDLDGDTVSSVLSGLICGLIFFVFCCVRAPAQHLCGPTGAPPLRQL